jgi:hypothetical protein
VTGGKPIAVLSQSYLRRNCYESFSRLLQHPWRKDRGAIPLFCPGHHMRQTHYIIRYAIVALNERNGDSAVILIA